MTSAYRVPWVRRWLRSFMQSAARIIFHILGRVEIEGLENVPTGGAYVIAFNHVSIFDPPLVLAFWPVQPEILGAVDIWSRPGQDVLARMYNAIPIRRGEVDRAALELTMAALRAGLPLMLSPEGGRSHQPGLRQGKPGVVYIIERTQAQVLPVGVTGTTDDFFSKAIHGQKPLLRMQIGKPFTLPEVTDPTAAPKEIRQRKVDIIMDRMAALLPVDYRGVYGD
ncbi:MAG TPA: lysophospholipid acyltransferase family protein [Anaerolineaceae bacterium]|jgi:1-acyl-sn-glycerol-3-phosphate acyltransferase